MPFVWSGISIVVCVSLSHFYKTMIAARGWPYIFVIDGPTYAGLLGTIAASAAAMLALFFTAISVVISTSYGKTSNEIRSLVADDNLNARYLKLLAHTAMTATGATCLVSMGCAPSALLAFYVLVLMAIGLLAFIPLAIRTFHLFDPATLAGYPAMYFDHALQIVVSDGKRWLSPSFQWHGNQKAVSQLERLREIVQYGTDDKPTRSVSVLNTGNGICDMLVRYAYQKHKVPSDSLWFSKKAEFTRWAAANGSTTDIALRTGTSTPQSMVPNFNFVEERCISMLGKCLRTLLQMGATDEAVNLSMKIGFTVNSLSTYYEYEASQQLTAEVQKAVVDYIQNTPSIPLANLLQLVDVAGFLSVGPILYPGRALSEFSVEMLQPLSMSILKCDRRTIHTNRLPRTVMVHIDDLVQRIEFENSVEGTVRTREWFPRHVVACAFAEAIGFSATHIVGSLKQSFVPLATEMMRQNQHAAAALWLQRGIEACEKAQRQIHSLELRHTELSNYRVGDRVWPSVPFSDHIAAIESERTAIVRLLAVLVPHIFKISHDESVPDLLGQSRALFGHELVSMMKKKQESGFPELFGAYLLATSVIREEYASKAQGPGKENIWKMTADVWLDIIDMSGLALLFSELDGTKFYDAVKQAWDTWMTSGDGPAIIKMSFASASLRHAMPFLSAGASQRFQWGAIFEEALKERGVGGDRFSALYGRHPDKVHHNPIIESLSIMPLHIEDPDRYFLALYLSKRPEAQGIELPRIVDECIKSIERAKQRIERAASKGRKNA